MSLLRFLVDYDFFGGAFELTVEGHSRTKTLLGFFLSLTFTSVILLATFKFSYQYFDVSRPRVLIKDIRNDTYPNITVNHDGIYYFLSVHGPGGYLAPQDIASFVNMRIRHEKIAANPNGTLKVETEEIGMQPCTELAWFSQMAEHAKPNHKKIATSFGLCSSKGDEKFLLYEGTDPPYGHVEVLFQRCQLAVCRTAEELAQLTFRFYTVEHYFDSTIRKNPLYLSSEVKTELKIRSGERTEYRYFVQDVKVATDTGVFSKVFDYKSGFQWSQPKEDKRKLYPSDSAYVQMNIYSSGRHIEYTRVYYKLLDLFSDIGGVIQIVSFVITVLYSRYNEYVQRRNLIRFGILGKARHPADIKPQTPNKVVPAVHKESSSNRPENDIREMHISGDIPPNKAVTKTEKPTNLELIEVPQGPRHSIQEEKGWGTPEVDFVAGGRDGKVSSKEGFGELAKARSKKLFNIDDYDFSDSLRLGLISKRVIESKDEMENKRAAFYELCEQQLDSLSDIYNLCSNLNTLTNLKDIVMLREQKVLAHYAALEFIHNEQQDSVDISYRDAIKELLLAQPTNTVQRLLNEYMLEKLKAFENRFNGEVHNVLRDVQKKEAKAARHSQNLQPDPAGPM